MNRLPFSKQVAVVSALCEGNSIRATSRMTGVAKGTILTLLEKVGTACAEFHDRTARNLNCKRIQCDEIWQFCYAKEKNVPADKKGQFGYGDVWTWTALDADTKLNISFLVARRDTSSAVAFMQDVAERIASRVQLTTAALILATIVVASKPYQTAAQEHNAPQSKEQPAPSASNESERPKSADDHKGAPNTDPPHWYTALERPEWWVVIVAGITALLILWQSWETRKAALAAKESAKSMVESERAWIIVEPDRRPDRLNYSEDYRNRGKSPYWITEIWVQIEVMDEIPKTPIFKDRARINRPHYVLSTDEEKTIGLDNLSCEGTLVYDVNAKGFCNPNTLVIIVKILYRDAIGTTGETMVGYKQSGVGSLQIVDSACYNYNR